MVNGVAGILLGLLLIVPAHAGQPEDFPRYGTEHGSAGKGEIRAKKYPGNLYGVEAFSRSKDMSAEQSAAVSRQVVLRAAQLALENDREYFGMFSPQTTQTHAETRHIRGIAPSSTWDRIPLPGGGHTYSAREIPGTPGRSYQLPRYEGAWAMVKLFRRDEVERRGAKPADGMTDYYAEAVYLDLLGSTPGRWPSLTAIYADLASRSEREAARSPRPDDARLTAINAHLKLSRLFREAGDLDRATTHLLRSGALIRELRK